MNRIMTEEQLRDFPILFQKEHTRSDKYSHISTIEKVNEIRSMGWNPVGVRQQNSKVYKGFQNHLVLFENEKFNDLFSRDGLSPQIVLQNSFNGLKSFGFHFGMYRFICANGLFVGESVLPQMKVLHKGIDKENLQTVMEDYVNQIPKVLESIETMKSTKISKIDKRDFAGKAIELRYPHVQNRDYPISVEHVLEERRPEDKENTVWATYNIIQESLQKGGQPIQIENKRRKTRTRALKDINRDIQINKELYNIALEYCA